MPPFSLMLLLRFRNLLAFAFQHWEAWTDAKSPSKRRETIPKLKLTAFPAGCRAEALETLKGD